MEAFQLYRCRGVGGGRGDSDNWKGFICCAPEFNQALTTDCEGDRGIPKIEQFVYKSNRVQSYVKILIISKITFIFVTKIKMLTPLVQFPTITFKTATNSGSKTAFHFWWEVRVFVLFLNGAIKQG